MGARKLIELDKEQSVKSIQKAYQRVILADDDKPLAEGIFYYLIAQGVRLSKDAHQQWHSVADKLPNDNDDILMRWPNEVVMHGKYFDGDGMLKGFAVSKGSHYVGKVGVTEWKYPQLPSDKESV